MSNQVAAEEVGAAAHLYTEASMGLENWDFDLAHSGIHFWVRHVMVSKVHGRFLKWSGSLVFDEANPAASHVEVKIDASSIYTEEEKRDAHLRSADFLEVEKFPQIHFKSTAIERDGENIRLTGDLTIHGMTRPVTLAVEYAGRVKDPWGGERLGFSAKTAISRKDFGLTWNVLLEAGGVTVGDKVEIGIEVEAVKAAAKAA
jgi:polyisoprenoid-binding protein YceI